MRNTSTRLLVTITNIIGYQKKVLSGGRVVYKIDQRFLIMPKVSRMLIKSKTVLQKVDKTQHFFLFGQRRRYEEDISCLRSIYSTCSQNVGPTINIIV